MASVYKTRENDMLDLICFKYYGESEGYVELIYQNNPHLLDYGAILPADIDIFLPDIVIDNEISLW